MNLFFLFLCREFFSGAYYRKLFFIGVDDPVLSFHKLFSCCLLWSLQESFRGRFPKGKLKFNLRRFHNRAFPSIFLATFSNFFRSRCSQRFSLISSFIECLGPA